MLYIHIHIYICTYIYIYIYDYVVISYVYVYCMYMYAIGICICSAGAGSARRRLRGAPELAVRAGLTILNMIIVVIFIMFHQLMIINSISICISLRNSHYYVLLSLYDYYF